MKNFSSLLICALISVVPSMYAKSAPADSQNKIATSAHPAETFKLASSTQIPGRTLEAGSYSIRVVDRLSDRIIIRVEQKGSEPTTFLALPKNRSAKEANTGPVMLGAKVDGKAALKGFAFKDGTVAEFVYPKAEAVTLAKANNTDVVAIDPASEGRVAEPALSADDMKMVTLWMLTPTPVGPDDHGAGIKAARYQQVAGVQSPRSPRPAMTALPHTAGLLPALWLVALLSACSAAFLLWRRTTSRAL